MAQQFYGLLVVSCVSLAIVGCGKTDNSLQQQKQLLDAMRLQQETLVAIDQKEKLLREQEKVQESRLDEIAKRETELRNQETHNDAALAEITSRQEQVKTLTDKVVEQNRRTEYFAQLASSRIPYLQILATEVAMALEHTAGPPEVEKGAYEMAKFKNTLDGKSNASGKVRREHRYPLILNLFYENHVHHIATDAACEMAAHKMIESYLLQSVEKQSDARAMMCRLREVTAKSSYFPQLRSRRIPYLKRLALETANSLANTTGTPEVEKLADQATWGINDSLKKEAARERGRRDYYAQLFLNMFYENDVQYLETDGDCEIAAYRFIESYLRQSIDKESDEKIIIDRIREAMAKSSK